MEITEQIIQRLECLKASDASRKLVAIAGTPASGKTTLARALTDNISNCACLSMDGFHLDNPILEVMNLSNRKGSPETFDVEGFRSLVTRLREPNDIYIPVFDRSSEKTINCGSLVPTTTEIVVLEGNYLLLDEPDWRGLSHHWDYTIFLETDLATIERRLMDRWLFHGYSREAAHAKISVNDLPNAHRILQHASPADLVIKTD
jgi:pantothenate kinase